MYTTWWLAIMPLEQVQITLIKIRDVYFLWLNNQDNTFTASQLHCKQSYFKLFT